MNGLLAYCLSASSSDDLDEYGNKYRYKYRYYESKKTVLDTCRDPSKLNSLMRNGENVFSGSVFKSDESVYTENNLNYVETILEEMRNGFSKGIHQNIYLVKVLMAYNINVLEILSKLIGNEYINGLLFNYQDRDFLIKIFTNYLSKKNYPMKDLDKYLLCGVNTSDIELIVYILKNYITPGKYKIIYTKDKYKFKRIGDFEGYIHVDKDKDKSDSDSDNLIYKFIINSLSKKKYSKDSKKIIKEEQRQRQRQQQRIRK